MRHSSSTKSIWSRTAVDRKWSRFQLIAFMCGFSYFSLRSRRRSHEVDSEQHDVRLSAAQMVIAIENETTENKNAIVKINLICPVRRSTSFACSVCDIRWMKMFTSIRPMAIRTSNHSLLPLKIRLSLVLHHFVSVSSTENAFFVEMVDVEDDLFSRWAKESEWNVFFDCVELRDLSSICGVISTESRSLPMSS